MNYKIVKENLNNVELYELKETKTASDKSTFEVWVLVKSYGKDTATQEIAEIDKSIEELNPTKASEKVAILEAKKIVLAEIEEVRKSKVIDTPVEEAIIKSL